MKKIITLLILLIIISCHKDETHKKVFSKNNYYDLAWEFLESDQSDSSFVYFNKAKEKSLNNDSVTVAKSLVNMAIISGDRGDYFGSQEISLSAIQYLNANIQNQKEILSSNYNNLGKMSHLLKKYEEADEFYLKAIALTKDESTLTIFLNNLAINLTSQKKYTDALKYFDQVMGLKSIKGDSITYSRVLSNRATTKWKQNQAYNPVPEILNALYIRELKSDLWGQNASLGHLVDYYTASKPDSAFFYTKRKYRIAQKIKSADDQLNSLQMLVKLSSGTDARHYFEVYEQLDDSVQTARNAAKNQFALIRYETEKNKADNLNLQKENAEKKYQITKQKFLLGGTFVLIVAGITILTLWYKKRKQKLTLESKAAIRENQLKIHKRVHDVVANGLYRMMSEIENREDMDKERILDGIEILYEQSRDITYEETPVAEPNFQEKINGLMGSFGANDRRISLVGNEAALWDQVSLQAKHEIEHILQELMVNMKKHSEANNVVVRFERIGNQVNIHYTDDGIGIKGKPNFKNGLTNTGNRIGSIGGTITFDTKIDRGLIIHISFTTS